ncbi:hypothetical protein [Metabacillus litoralis]|jgi:hypothetical protein|uniref:hypothetical protein n=1 Tax=Metabacillus litoralis TaxID=152268 RepID=UPI00203F7BFA|nr:hypothetical protein [Metabacillus litoralis]MCM3651395.1 hypothetical protein [Metabacillus litoralis]
MNQAFNRIFWGYLFVLIEIHIIVIDILADPVGYYLIFSGITMLLKNFPIAHKARKLSFALIFISIPSVFIQQNAGINQLEQLSFLSGWSLYMIVLDLVKLILVFYIFQLIMTIVHKHADDGLLWIVLITIIISFIMEIVFLILLWSLRKVHHES